MIDIIFPTWIPSDEIEDMTVACLERLREMTKVPYRLIWIDDGSGWDRVQKICAEVKNHHKRKVEIYEKNKGFSVVANRGLQLVKSEYFVLISNDVLVTKWWLRKLIEVMETHPDIGILSPVTTKGGKWQPYPRVLQKFDWKLDGKTPEDFFNKKSKSVLYIPDWLAFFCVAMRKDLIESVGTFDERFYCGGEDPDYSERAVKAGWKLAICLHCFVYHKHWATRKLIPDYKEIEKKNVQLLRQKRRERNP